MEPNYLYAIITIAAGLVIAGAAHVIIRRLQKRADTTDTYLDDIILVSLGKPLVVAIIAVSGYVALTEFVIAPESLTWAFGETTITGYQVINSFFIVLASWIVSTKPGR
jgi:MscS family membrane protein